jgi:2-hydroxycyclohexanecarboxyl-CoA dehydrogenase
MDLALKGKVAIITGGASGIGRETAHYMAQDGAKLVIADRDAENIEHLLTELRAQSATAEGFTLDVQDYSACQKMAAFARETFGRVDILVAGAGILSDGFFLDSSPEDWTPLIGVNILGMLNVNHAVAPIMVEQESGSIINVASEVAKVGEKRIAVYGATKGAVMSFTKAFALEMGRCNVRVNAVCPAVTMTPMTTGGLGELSKEDRMKHPHYQASAKLYPLGRLGEPEDIAAMITFLASPQSSWTTGQAISVNGGFGRS